jgi:hypothetical protein
VIVTNRCLPERPEIGQVSWLDEGVAEVSLLLPAGQAAELVTAAAAQRLTAGQLPRVLVRKHLVRRPTRS